MPANTVNGDGNGARSGAQTLIMLAAPLNVLILKALAEGARQQSELRHATGSPAQTTLRALLKRLVEIGAIEKHRRNRFPGVLEYELTAQGQDLLSVLAVLERWLSAAPNGPLTLGENPAKAAVKALAEGWSTTMLRALATGPLSLTELDRIIGSLSYPSLERRLAALRLAGLVEHRQGAGRGTPYAVTEWLRSGIAPLTAACRWERRYLPTKRPPITRLDIETAFLLVVPSVDRLEADLSGCCRLAVEIPNGKGHKLAGVVVQLEDGALVGTCSTNLNSPADAWALGSVAAWLDAVIELDTERLELGGDCRLAGALAGSLHERLFKVRASRC